MWGFNMVSVFEIKFALNISTFCVFLSGVVSRFIWTKTDFVFFTNCGLHTALIIFANNGYCITTSYDEFYLKLAFIYLGYCFFHLAAQNPVSCHYASTAVLVPERYDWLYEPRTKLLINLLRLCTFSAYSMGYNVLVISPISVFLGCWII